jgi:hypothetical protein
LGSETGLHPVERNDQMSQLHPDLAHGGDAGFLPFSTNNCGASSRPSTINMILHSNGLSSRGLQPDLADCHNNGQGAQLIRALDRIDFPPASTGVDIEARVYTHRSVIGLVKQRLANILEA